MQSSGAGRPVERMVLKTIARLGVDETGAIVSIRVRGYVVA
jgi:hypothetical protein